MEIKIIKVTDKGQISLPVEVRESANIGIGDNIILIQKDKKIMLEKVEFIENKIEDDFRDLLKLSEISLKDIWGNKEDEIWNTYLKKK